MVNKVLCSTCGRVHGGEVHASCREAAAPTARYQRCSFCGHIYDAAALPSCPRHPAPQADRLQTAAGQAMPALPAPPRDDGAGAATATVPWRLTLRRLLFSFRGRIGRGAYLVGSLLTWIIVYGAMFLVLMLGTILGLIEPSRAGASGQELDVLVLPSVGLFLWCGLALSAKRCHDMDCSAAALLWGIVPIASIVLCLWLLLGAGSDGPNRWGNTMRWRGAG
jgi:uncharacterized membrane protein YhaH (DUF805 family)